MHLEDVMKRERERETDTRDSRPSTRGVWTYSMLRMLKVVFGVRFCWSLALLDAFGWFELLLVLLPGVRCSEVCRWGGLVQCSVTVWYVAAMVLVRTRVCGLRLEIIYCSWRWRLETAGGVGLFKQLYKI